MQPPQPGHGLAVHQLEDALLPVAPLDELGTAVFILKQRWYRSLSPEYHSHLKQFEQELPQVGGGALPGLALAGDPVRPHLGRPGLLLGPLELGLVRAGEGDGVGGVVAGVGVRVGGRGTRTCEMNIFRSCKNI